MGKRIGHGLALVIVAVAAAGCMADPAIFADQWQEGTHLSLSLADLPAGSEYVLLEIEMPNSRLYVNTSVRWPMSSPENPCFVHGLGNRWAPWVDLGPPPVGLGASAADREPLVEHRIIQGEFNYSAEDEWQEHAQGQRLPLVFGTTIPVAKSVLGMSMRLDVEAHEPFRWRLSETGTFECRAGAHDYERGEFVATPGLVMASGLGTDFEVPRAALGWFALRADISHDVKIHHDGRQMWSSTGGFGESAAIAFDPLPPGQYHLEIEEANGQRVEPVLFLLDLPPWAAEAMLERATE